METAIPPLCLTWKGSDIDRIFLAQLVGKETGLATDRVLAAECCGVERDSSVGARMGATEVDQVTVCLELTDGLGRKRFPLCGRER